MLVLDHIADDAHLDRPQRGQGSGYQMQLRMRAAGWPQGRLQVLCANCNTRKEAVRRRTAVLARIEGMTT